MRRLFGRKVSRARSLPGYPQQRRAPGGLIPSLLKIKKTSSIWPTGSKPDAIRRGDSNNNDLADATLLRVRGVDEVLLVQR